MIYLICKRVQKLIRKKREAERRLFVESHEMAPLAAPRSEFRSKTSVRVDPTASVQNLSNIEEETPSEKFIRKSVTVAMLRN